MAGAVARTTGRPGSAVGVSWYARAAIIEHDANVDMALVVCVESGSSGDLTGV